MLADRIESLIDELKELKVSSDVQTLNEQVEYCLFKVLPFAKMVQNDELESYILMSLTYERLYELMNMEIRINSQSLILEYSKTNDNNLRIYFQEKLKMDITKKVNDPILNENISVLNAIEDRKSAFSQKSKIKRELNNYPTLRDKIISYGWLLSLTAVLLGTAKLSHDNNQLYNTSVEVYSSDTDETLYENPKYMKLTNDGEEVKIVEYTHYLKDDNEYERKIYNYDASLIELDNISDYLELDLYEFPVEEIVESAKELDINEFYNHSIYEVKRLKQDLNDHVTDKEQVTKDILTVFFTYICATIIIDIIVNTKKYGEFNETEMLYNKVSKLKNTFKKKKIKELINELEDTLDLIEKSSEINPYYKRYVDDFKKPNDCFEETIDVAKKTLRM